MKKLTVKDLLDLKGKKQLTEVFVTTPDEARACEAAGIDMIVAVDGRYTRAIREAAPNTFLTLGPPEFPASKTEAISGSFKLLRMGGDAIYCGSSLDIVAAMAREDIPVVGHVGLIPYKSTWVGGFRAVGKTADEAKRVYERTVAYQEAGAIIVEMEVVPEKIAAEISRQVHIIVLSMGSGTGCDGQYLFARDILGSHNGHVPRHAKVYRNFYEASIEAFKEFRAEVKRGTFPGPEHIIGTNNEEYEKFLKMLENDQMDEGYPDYRQMSG